MLTASVLTGLAVKSLVLASVTLALLRVVCHRSPAERSLIAHLGLLALLLLPLASLLLPHWTPLPQAMLAARTEAATPGPIMPTLMTVSVQSGVAATTPVLAAPIFRMPSGSDLILWLYALPLGLLMMAMFVAVIRLLKMRRTAEVVVDSAWLSALAEAQRRMGFKHGTALLVSKELRSPISWGIFRPTILLNSQNITAPADAEAIIAHELAHVTGFDWAKLLIARTTCALFWFNPLVWLLARESHQLREEAADDSVLLTNIVGSDYATLLVNAARHDNSGVLVAAHGVAPAKNSLRRRVERVLDGSVRREPMRTKWAAASMVAALGATAPLAAFSTQAPKNVEPVRLVATTTPVARPTSPAAVAPVMPVASAAAGQQEITESAPVSVEDLVSMRAAGVTPEDVARIRNSVGEIDADAIIAAKATGVSPDYLAEMKAALGNVDVSELVGARAVGVEADYVRAMRAVDPRADLDAIIGALAVGVSPTYAEEIRAHFPRVSLEELIGMRAIGVTGDYMRELRAAGLNVRSPDDAISMRAVTSRQRRAPNVPRPESAPAARAVVFPGGVAVISGESEDGADAVILNGPPPIPRRSPD